MLLQASEEIAKKYGGNKQKIAQAVQMGLLGPTEAVLAGMFIDRMREAQAEEQKDKRTVAQQVLSPEPAPQGMPAQPPMPTGVNVGMTSPKTPMPQGMPPQGMPAQTTRGMPTQTPRGMGATPQATQMQAMQRQMAPRPSVAGMNQLPMGPGMIPRAASGGLLAFAGGGDVPGYNTGGGLRYGTPYSNPVILDPFTNQRDARLERRSLISEKERLLRNDFLPNSAAVSDIDQQIQRFDDFLSIPKAELMERRAIAEAGNTPPRITTINTGPQSYDPLTQGKIPGNMMGMGDGTVMPNDPNERYIDPVERAPSEEFVTLDGTGADLYAKEEKGLRSTPEAVKAAEEGVISPREAILSEAMPDPVEYVGTTTPTIDQIMAADAGASPPNAMDLMGDIKKQITPNNQEKPSERKQTTAERDLEKLRAEYKKDYEKEYGLADAPFTDTTVDAETSAAEIDAIVNPELGEGEKDLETYYKNIDARLAAEEEKDLGMSLAKFGFALLGSKESNFASAIGDAGGKTLDLMMQQAKDRRARKKEAIDKRATLDVTRNNRRMENLKLAIGKGTADQDRKLKAEYFALQEKNKFHLKDMSNDALLYLNATGFINQAELQDVRIAAERYEKAEDRELSRNTSALNASIQISEGAKDRDFQLSKLDKTQGFAAFQSQLEREFKGAENALSRATQERIAKAQINKPTDFDKQVAREAAYLRTQKGYEDIPKAELEGIAQDNVISANTTSANALKIEMWKYENSVKLQTEALEAWDKAKLMAPYVGMDKETLKDAKQTFIKNRVNTVTNGVFDTVFNSNRRVPQASSGEVTRDFTEVNPK
jgi:hypothetical protein